MGLVRSKDELLGISGYGGGGLRLTPSADGFGEFSKDVFFRKLVNFKVF